METRPLALRDITEPTITMDCRKCGRHGELNVKRLRQRYGSDLLIAVLVEIASRDCEFRERGQTDRCGAFCGTLEAMKAAPDIGSGNAYARAKGGE